MIPQHGFRHAWKKQTYPPINPFPVCHFGHIIEHSSGTTYHFGLHLQNCLLRKVEVISLLLPVIIDLQHLSHTTDTTREGLQRRWLILEHY